MSLRNLFATLCALMIAVQPLCAVERGNGILYVNSQQHGSVQDGRSWKTAYSDLQDALTEAELNFTISKIKIACGVYKPSKTYSPKDANQVPVVAGAMSLPQYNPGITNDGIFLNYADDPTFYNGKLRTFQLIDGVDLIGGCRVKGNSSACCQTILDGNLGTKENPDKVWHVLTAGNDITIEGVSCNLINLTLQNGDALPAPYFPTNFLLNPGQVPVYYHDNGGGLYVTCKSYINLSNITVRNTQGVAAGGVYADDGSIMNFTCCSFIENFGNDASAIAIRSGGAHNNIDYNGRISSAYIKNCKFLNNYGIFWGTVSGNSNYFDPDGIGIYDVGPNITIEGSTFRDTNPYGTIVTERTNYQMIDSEIDNLGVEGGLGVYIGNPTYTKISGCLIKNNFNNNIIQGAGISMGSPGNSINNYTEITNCTFLNNTTIDAEGGALSLRSNSSFGGLPIKAVVKNNIFKNNSSNVAGGAIYLRNVVGLNNFCADNEFEGNSAPIGPNLFAEPDVYLPAPCTTF